MVWGLFPVDPLSGEEKYYIFAPGKYKLGRKGCDITITKDKGVSRIHAEVIVDAMISLGSRQSQSSDIMSKVRIHDCSKYGTCISKNLGIKEKIHELPNKEASLDDGDLISFGTGAASYRFSFVSIVFCACSLDPYKVNQPLKDKVSLLGACVSDDFNQEYTHVLVDELMPLNKALIDAIVAKKPIILSSWVEYVAGKNISTEIPTFDSYFPTLDVEGVSVKVADTKARENCLRGYTFLLDSKHTYKFGDHLELLLLVCGAKSFSIEEFCLHKQDIDDVDNSRVVFIVPGGSVKKSDSFHKLDSVYKLYEVDLIRAVICGKLDFSTLASPCVESSSCSTDETIVEESDLEVETATSGHATSKVSTEGPDEHMNKPNIPIIPAATQSEDYLIRKPRDHIDGMATKLDKVDEPAGGNTDIIYSQDLIVRKPSVAVTPDNPGVISFKRFRKTNNQAGNSFYSLIPFSKYPYKDSDYGSEEMVESVKEERKRKQMEAIAEDLFNNEKGRRKGVAASLHGLLNRA